MIGYARVSTAEQSLDGQRDALQGAGCERVAEETGSGRRGAVRPVWDETVRNLRHGDTLVVTELSRLGRSTTDLSLLCDDFQQRGVALRVLNLGGGAVDTSSASGRLLFDVLAAVAQMERTLLIERTKRGLAAARARGRRGGRQRKLSGAQIKAAQALRDSGKLTMAEIAQQMGVSRGTLYRHLEVSEPAQRQ